MYFLYSVLFHAGCHPDVDLIIAVDASESVIVGDPYGKPLYNWKRVCFLSPV